MSQLRRGVLPDILPVLRLLRLPSGPGNGGPAHLPARVAAVSGKVRGLYPQLAPLRPKVQVVRVPDIWVNLGNLENKVIK